MMKGTEGNMGHMNPGDIEIEDNDKDVALAEAGSAGCIMDM